MTDKLYQSVDVGCHDRTAWALWRGEQDSKNEKRLRNPRLLGVWDHKPTEEEISACLGDGELK